MKINKDMKAQVNIQFKDRSNFFQVIEITEPFDDVTDLLPLVTLPADKDKNDITEFIITDYEDYDS